MGAPAALLPLLISAATAAGGAGLEMSAANSESKAMNDAVAAEEQRQQQFSQRGQQAVNKNIQASTPQAAQKDINADTAKQLAQYSQLENVPVSTAGSATAASPVVNAEAGAQTKQMNDAAAQMAGYGSWENALSLNNQNVNNTLGVINTESQGWQSVLSSQLSQAQGSKGAEQAAGSLLGSLGSTAGSALAMQPYLQQIQSLLANQRLSGMTGAVPSNDTSGGSINF